MRKKMSMKHVTGALVGLGLLTSATMASAGVSRVLCVPMQGDPAKFHTAISGQAVTLTAVLYGDAAGGTYTYTWNFSDGTPNASAAVFVPPNGIYNLEVSHSFTGALNTPFNTTLTIDGKSDTYNVVLAPDSNDSKVNIAIDKGLWYLHKNAHRYNIGLVPAAHWDANASYTTAGAAAAAWAFEVQGHRLNIETNPYVPVQDPYVEDVQLAINKLLNDTAVFGTSVQTRGNPDTNGNGFLLATIQDRSWNMYTAQYTAGMAMGAIAGSGAPTATAAVGQTTYVLGRTYKDIAQDMVDYFSWSQIDDASFPPTHARGGWYYEYSNNYSWNYPYYGDNSVSQWAYIGLEAAQTFGCTVPDWVKRELAGYLHGQLAYYNRGYVSYRAGYPGWSDFEYSNVTLTGGALVGMGLVSQTLYDVQNGLGAYAADLNLAKNFLGANWLRQDSRWGENWYGHRAYYAMYSVMKGLRMQGIDSLPGGYNWYTDYVSVMLPGAYQGQGADGSWLGSGWMDGYIQRDIATAFGVLILTPSVFTPPPNACFTATPTPGYKDFPVTFDPSCSAHADASRLIVSYEWDFNNDGIYDATSSTPVTKSTTWNSVGNYPVTLRVTDNSTPALTDTYTLTVSVTNPAFHPPQAETGGPYTLSLCAADTLTLDGSASYDLDEGTSASGNPPFDTITAWNWDLDGSPWTYASGSGETLTVGPAGFTAGAKTIGLRVTDNNAAAFPASGMGNLTGEDFGQLTVYQGCICNLAARPKSGKVQLTWTHTGAASYDVYRSTAGPNTGFVLVKAGLVTTYATYLDEGLTNGVKYYYRVMASTGCGSKSASATPSAAAR